MRAGLIAQRLSEVKLEEITKIMQAKGISVRTLTINEIPEFFSNFDFIIVIGSDGDVLRAIQAMHDKVLPVLGVSDSNELGFLTEINWILWPVFLIPFSITGFVLAKSIWHAFPKGKR